MYLNKQWITVALAVSVSIGSQKVSHAGGLFGNGASKAAQTGQAQGHHNHDHTNHAHDHVNQVSAEVGAQTPDGTVISVTPIYPPGEEPGKASFDGTRSDAKPMMVSPVGRTNGTAHIVAEPTPIGVVQTNYNMSSGANQAARMPSQVDVMAHGRSAGMGPQGMGAMPPGMMPPGQAPGMPMKSPRRGLLGFLRPGKAAANDPYAVFNMSKAQRSAHAAMPVGPQAHAPVNSLPASAVYNRQGTH